MKKIFTLVILLVVSALAVKAEDFAYSKQWLALGHYQKGWLGSYKSSIDSENFFISPEGKQNPDMELEATIKMFNQGDDIEKLCLFPARYLLLKNNRLISDINVNCKEYQKFKSDLSAAGVTLLFTDAYMNNPSSLFGHTLIRIDTTRKGTQLLAHGANYGAFTNDETGLLYAIYGLTGGYYGGWTVKPYYDIINTYNNIENRDIWELNLNLSPEEIEMFIAHSWEMGQTQTKYYFFTKNCSYMIMEALDAIRPELKLAQKFSMQVIPLDTFKAVAQSESLVKDINYRPSRQSKIIYRYKQMSKNQQKALIQMVKKQMYGLDGFTVEEKAELLETAYQYVQYQYVKKDLELADYRERSFQLLKARSQIADAKASIEEIPEGHSPLKAHDSMRFSIGIGSRNGQSFEEISFRPAYHSLTDNDYGLQKGAEINFLNSKLRHYDNKTVLHELNILEIKSLSPITPLFSPTSFALGLNFRREIRPDNQKEGYVFNANFKGGATYELTNNIWVYGQGGIYGSYGGFLPQNQYVGVGFTLGAYLNFEYFRIIFESEKIFASSWYGNKLKYKAEAALSLTKSTAVVAEYNFMDNQKGKDEEEYITSFRLYF